MACLYITRYMINMQKTWNMCNTWLTRDALFTFDQPFVWNRININFLMRIYHCCSRNVAAVLLMRNLNLIFVISMLRYVSYLFSISDYRAELYTRLVIEESRKQARKPRVKRNQATTKNRQREVSQVHCEYSFFYKKAISARE